MAVVEPLGEAVVEFDGPVRGFGAAVVRVAGGEVGQERVLSCAWGAAWACNLRDGQV